MDLDLDSRLVYSSGYQNKMLIDRYNQRKAQEVAGIIRDRQEEMLIGPQLEKLMEAAGRLPKYPGYYDSSERQKVAYAEGVWRVALGDPYPKSDPRFWAAYEILSKSDVEGVSGILQVRDLASRVDVTAENLLQAGGCKSHRGYNGFGWSGASTYNSARKEIETAEKMVEARRGFLDEFPVKRLWSPGKNDPFLADVCRGVGAPVVVDFENKYYFSVPQNSCRYRIVEYQPKKGPAVRGVILGEEKGFFQTVPLVCRVPFEVKEEKKQIRVSKNMCAEMRRLYTYGRFESRGTVFTPGPEGLTDRVPVYLLTEENFLTDGQFQKLMSGNWNIPGIRLYDSPISKFEMAMELARETGIVKFESE